jgi:hypothetical protein
MAGWAESGTWISTDPGGTPAAPIMSYAQIEPTPDTGPVLRGAAATACAGCRRLKVNLDQLMAPSTYQ